MKDGKINISRINSNTLSKPCLNITVYDDKYRIVFEGFMELEDFAKVITGQGNIDILYRTEDYGE